MSLEIRGLSKRYPNGVQALNNLSLTIGNNMFGLLGPNGAGKSTLMRTIATLQEPDSGTILLNGLDVVANKDAVRRQLGYLPQEFGVYPRISAVDMLHHLAVMKGVHKSGERKEIVDALLKQTNLWDARKMRANGEGTETQIPIHDLIEVGVFKGKKDSEEPLHTEKVWITQPRTTLEFIVNEPPTRAAIDPYSKLIDRNPEDNWADVE